MPKNPHFTYTDKQGIVWIEMVCCRHCQYMICNALSALIIGGATVECNGCGQKIHMRDETFIRWTDAPPMPAITNVWVTK